MAASERSDVENERTLHSKDELGELARSVRSGTFHYEGRPKKSLDWFSYNEAKVDEMADTPNLIRRFVDRASARIPKRPR